MEHPGLADQQELLRWRTPSQRGPSSLAFCDGRPALVHGLPESGHARAAIAITTKKAMGSTNNGLTMKARELRPPTAPATNSNWLRGHQCQVSAWWGGRRPLRLQGGPRLDLRARYIREHRTPVASPVIWESQPWREELCRVAAKLNGWSRAVDWDDDYVTFEIERDVMVSAYAIRKLVEARKLADSTMRSTVHVEAFPLIERIPDLMNWDRLDEFYDFERSRTEELGLRELCNQLIHSFIFVQEVADAGTSADGLAGFLVASDRARLARLYRIKIDSLIGLLQLVGTEEVVASQMIRDAKSGQWRVSSLTAAERDANPAWRDFARNMLRVELESPISSPVVGHDVADNSGWLEH